VDLFQTVVLALIQGLTEFLPVSSSAHLIFPSQLLGWPDQGLSFDVAVHFGTLAAVMIFYRHWLIDLANAFLKHPQAVMFGKAEPEHSKELIDRVRLLRALIIGSIPVIIGGLILEVLVPAGIRSTHVIAWATIVFALVLWIADRYATGHKDEYTLTLQTALIIGLAQVLALIPGTSRSGITIAAGLLVGLSATGSANFSFLLSIPTILAATLLKSFELVLSPADIGWMSLIIGAVVSGCFAYLTIGWFIAFLNKVGMIPFVIYRLLLGLALLALF